MYDNLNDNQIYICCGETITQRSLKFRNKIRFGFKNIFLVVDFFSSEFFQNYHYQKLFTLPLQEVIIEFYQKQRFLAESHHAGSNIKRF